MKVLVAASDNFAPLHFTVIQPHKYLIKYGVETDYTSVLPSEENRPGTSFEAIVRMVERYDLILLQRVTQLPIMQMFRNACDILGKPLLFICDDDYIHLERHNPCYYTVSLSSPLMNQWKDLHSQGKVEEAALLEPQMEVERQQAQRELRVAWSLPDHVITTTEELAEVVRPYNKHISVFPNQMERVYWERDYCLEEMDQNGNLKMPPVAFGMGSVPAFYPVLNDKNEVQSVNRIVRIGYSCTPTHQRDFLTIVKGFNEFAKKYGPRVRFVFIGDGDGWFSSQITEAKNRSIVLPPTDIPTYHSNLRNLDIGIAPLEPTIFNMSKSELKALETGSWGAVPVLPDFTTYRRGFEDGKTALFYHDNESFYKALEYLVTHDTDRRRIGNNARKMIAGELPEQNGVGRLEKHHSERRFNLLQSLMENAVGLRRFQPVC